MLLEFIDTHQEAVRPRLGPSGDWEVWIPSGETEAIEARQESN